MVDMTRVSTQTNRSNLEHAFCVAEQLGVARLLDPEGESCTHVLVSHLCAVIMWDETFLAKEINPASRVYDLFGLYAPH